MLNLSGLPSHPTQIMTLRSYDAMTEKKFFCRNCFCSDDLEDLLSELVADYGDVDNFVLSLQNCRFFDNLVFDSHGHDNCHVCGHVKVSITGVAMNLDWSC